MVNTQMRAPTYIALEVLGAAERVQELLNGGMPNVVSIPYVIQVTGPDANNVEKTDTKLVGCDDDCTFSTTQLFTLKPSAKYATPAPAIAALPLLPPLVVNAALRVGRRGGGSGGASASKQTGTRRLRSMAAEPKQTPPMSPVPAHICRPFLPLGLASRHPSPTPAPDSLSPRCASQLDSTALT